MRNDDLLPIRPRLAWVLLAGLLAANVLLQARGLFVPHVTGDQRFYVALALKLDAQGLAGYNLRQVAVRAAARGSVAFSLAEDADGDLLPALREWGTTFYDEPLFHTPPLFPWTLVAAHGLTAPGPDWLVLGRQGAGNPWDGVGDRAWALLVPIVGGFTLVLGTFLLGRMVAGLTGGLLAACLVAFSPIQALAG